jgi:hypothetical protein
MPEPEPDDYLERIYVDELRRPGGAEKMKPPGEPVKLRLSVQTVRARSNDFPPSRQKNGKCRACSRSLFD